MTAPLARHVAPTGQERRFSDDEIIVTKTDLTGKLTYCNEVFLRVSIYREEECLGQPHSMIRHPDMPRAVFKLLWDSLHAQREIFAYVVNLASNGDHYWVLAHVTPTFDPSGQVIGYHSSRRVPHPDALRVVQPLYRDLRQLEQHGDRREGLIRSVARFEGLLAERGMSYDEWVWSLEPQTAGGV